MILELLGTVLGLAMLMIGANFLVDGAAGIARKKGISGHVIGVTLVATATSLPELATSITAAIEGESGIAIGNIVGSNAFNVGVVLALSAMIMPVVSESVVRRDGFFVWGATMLFAVLAMNGVNRWEAFILLVLYIAYVVYLFKATKLTGKIEVGEKGYLALSLMFIGGFILLCVGSPLLVRCARDLAFELGVDSSVIAVTLIAAGTSLPELITGVVAAIKGHEGMAVGNVLGSNLFNILMIPGVAGLISALEVTDLFSRAMIPAMMILTVLAVVLSWKKMGKFSGALLFLGFCAFMFLLVQI
ncbi:MAG: calcium/sodium antiporter [Candidatus Thermoplasmatota archaeon]|nr:calcium/sodium antiporter [Candidatus Thermoplasmatota archaeon]